METKNPIVESEERAEKNLWLWRINEQTDPDKVKAVTIGRKFTAIDTYYQIKRATETFGPVGTGWGWDLEEETVTVPGKDRDVSFAKCKVTLWYMQDERRFHCGPVIGMNQLVSDAGRPDDEAFKKATTDGITKALSYLGFSADIFMGLWDDSKYVDSLRKQANEKLDATGQRLPEVVAKAVASLPTLRDSAELNITWKALQPDLRKLPAPALDFVKARFARRRNELAPPQESEVEGDHRTGGPTTQP